MRRSKAVKAATAACMPRLVRGGGGCRASTARPAASVSLLERIRDVVLRLIMLSAVSRASVQRTTSSGRAKASSPRAGRHRDSDASVPVTCRRDDSIRNEAVEDCIDFLKRSSAEGDAAKLSSATAADDVVGKESSMAGANAKLSATGGEDKEAAFFFVVNVGARVDETSPSA
ncbi:hypothetical protein PR202_ga08125 [Eleusine coracana subsp. coracana]|uniref:Josephin-like protein n=1 Tax=Eleusine coracana subsp. coracana TaxID=191504 RepID=A0AAV5C2E1_ELECO|nr:hypothetical protein PR202_ga08125 [Eleusine coracana subsp. coracana]